MSKDAKKEFRRVVKMLGEMNLIGVADGNALTRYAITWVRWRQAIQLVEKSGEVVVYRDDEGKPKAVQPSAFHAIARSLAEELSRLEQQLGMNPAARSRISCAPAAAPASDAKSRFFGMPVRF